MRTLEAVVEEVRSAETAAGTGSPPRPKISPAGWLVDEPDLADRLEMLTAELRARGRVRGPEDESWRDPAS